MVESASFCTWLLQCMIAMITISWLHSSGNACACTQHLFDVKLAFQGSFWKRPSRDHTCPDLGADCADQPVSSPKISLKPLWTRVRVKPHLRMCFTIFHHFAPLSNPSCQQTEWHNPSSDSCTGQARRAVRPHFFYDLAKKNQVVGLVRLSLTISKSFFLAENSTPMPWEAQFHHKFRRWPTWERCMPQNGTFVEHWSYASLSVGLARLSLSLSRGHVPISGHLLAINSKNS